MNLRCIPLLRLLGRIHPLTYCLPPLAAALAPATAPAPHTRTQVPGHALGACKEAINKAAADALLAYRAHCANASSSGQLILPEALKLLPLYTLALTKAPVFRTDARPDARAAAMWRLLSLPAGKIVPLVYPRLVLLNNLLERPDVRARLRRGGVHCLPATAAASVCWLPSAIHPRPTPLLLPPCSPAERDARARQAVAVCGEGGAGGRLPAGEWVRGLGVCREERGPRHLPGPVW